jgi:nucleoside-diphosphate-sugar epimerase
MSSFADLHASLMYFWRMVDGSSKNGLTAIGLPTYIDSRDVALAHLRAIESDKAKNQRYLILAGPYVRLFLVFPLCLT